MNLKNRAAKLGDILISSGRINDTQLDEALQLQKKTGQKLGEILVEFGWVKEKEIIDTLENQMGIEKYDIQNNIVEAEIPKLISENLARRYTAIPVKVKGDKLTVAMYDPLNIYAIDDIEIATGLKVDPVLASKKDIVGAIDQYFGKQNAEKAIEDFAKQYNGGADESNITEESLEAIKNAPVVRLVNSIMKQALKARASDIHIEPFENIVRIRFRIDGQLQEVMTPSKQTHSAIITRIKIIANLNIAEKRNPQDGRVEMEIDGGMVDMRISILPTVHGEKIVIRLLERSSFLMGKTELGFTDYNLKKFEDILDIPNGIILVTGPTGSGKTTTLYTVLSDFNKVNTNIVTVEDPVEYRMDGINQVQVNEKAGLTFASGLRSILRQDPDIIMIGEIRDMETAQIAVRAAITGHIVISTLHTNDAPATIMRLIDMGIPAYLISTSVKGIVAQRLVRRICPHCKETYPITISEKKILKIEEDVMLFRGKGCNMCFKTGYLGRISIHEIMKMTAEVRKEIDTTESTDLIRAAAAKQGMVTLEENCRDLVLSGITTIEEMLKVSHTVD
ncbi:MAG: ATPase, T2SS/T4P/T4SS family [Eubacteriales bacterium]|nr:ATPase, T2SS/T4P/T4SS family [Eubacteriales bacterium]